jgi:tetratricopeptide (TPR) repeat protein
MKLFMILNQSDGSLFSRQILLAGLMVSLMQTAALAAFPRVLLVENHGDVLVPWIRAGVRNAVVVNVDAHDDCVPISRKRADKLRSLLAAGEIAAIERANSDSDSGLYSIYDYIPAACALGIAKEAIWVAPQLPESGTPAWAHPIAPDIPVSIRSLESLPEIQGQVLLTVDADIIPTFASYRCITQIEAVLQIAKTLRALPWDVKHASVCFSNDGGFLPVTLRWVGNALYEALDGKNPLRQDAPWLKLCEVEDWRRTLLPQEFVRKVQQLVRTQQSNPWLRVYLAEALFKITDIPGALKQGLEAARLDSGCSRILPEIGSQLADAGLLEDAEKFVYAAPGVVNVPAEITIAEAFLNTGDWTRAIKHLSRISKHVAFYSSELLIGFGYEKLGDRKNALNHYLRAVALLDESHGPMPPFPDITPALQSAARFLQSSGKKHQAQALRKDERLVKYFK